MTSLAELLSGHSVEVVPRLAVEPREAAAAIGVSLRFFIDHVQPELRVVRRGRKVLIPTKELQRWVDDNAAPTL